jgi:hypothetical protein
LYENDAEPCKEAFKKFVENIINNSEDPAFVNFLKTALLEFKEHYHEAYQQSNLTEITERLSA